MAVSEHHAKRLLREVRGRTSLLLERPKYWDLTVLRLFLDHCDAVLFDDPKAGFKLAEVAPRLARLIPERSPAAWQLCATASEKQHHRELLVRSYAILGGGHRAAGRFQQAENAYDEACRICDSHPVSSTARANLYKRFGRLRSAQKRSSEALDLIEFAIEVYREQDQTYFADALLMKGYVLVEAGRSAEAIPFFSKALSLIKPKLSASLRVKNTFHSAVHNLATAIADGCCSANDITIALSYVAQAKKFFARKASCINKHKLAWVEGRLVAKLGSTRLAERRFRGALKQFLKLGAPVEAALVGLDLALIYHQHQEWQELEALSTEIYTRFRDLGGGMEGLAALRLWVDGTEKAALAKANILSARQMMERLAGQRKP